MTDDDMRKLFGDGFDDYQAKAEQKWGETIEWHESQRRAKSYGKDDWIRIKLHFNATTAPTANPIGVRPTVDHDHQPKAE